MPPEPSTHWLSRLGTQAKTQIDPSEEPDYVAGSGRRTFTAAGVTFGIAICHEACRYPEVVRAVVLDGAQVVFVPHYVTTDDGSLPERWCDASNPYNEKALLVKAAFLRAEKRIESRVEELKAVEARISTSSAQKSEADAARFKGIITMYEGMKPKDAAKVFDRLEMSVLFEIASQIAPRKMSDILGLMQPVTSRCRSSRNCRSGRGSSCAPSPCRRPGSRSAPRCSTSPSASGRISSSTICSADRHRRRSRN